MPHSLERLSFLLILVTSCATEPKVVPATPSPPPPPTVPAGSLLEVQIAAHRPSLLAGLDAPSERKTLMKEIAKQLGVDCDYCHDVADFAAATPNKTIANYMFTHFAVGLVRKSDEPTTCGSCHQGQAKFLGDRGDKKRIAALMKTTLTEPFVQRGGGAAECATCHGDQLNRPFLPR